MALYDILFITGVALASTLFSELMSWLLIYRTDKYKALVEKLEEAASKVDRAKERVARCTNAKKAAREEENVKLAQQRVSELKRDFSFQKFGSSIIVTLVLIGVYSLLSSSYSGIVVAKLPFEPIAWFQGITHRGLAGDNFYEASMSAVYAMVTVGLRANFSKLVTTPPPKAAAQGGMMEMIQSAAKQQAAR